MMYERVKVKSEDAAKFMNEVKPISASIDLHDKDYVFFEFENYADFERAQQWVYANYDHIIIGDDGAPIGNIYYDHNVGYCFVCDYDGHEEQGFKSPLKAEDEFFYYYGAEVGVA